jgi:ATPase subunit of ABC transporter with duplicated ATPase domains
MIPIKCPELSYCPEGSWTPLYYGPLVYFIVIDIILVIICISRNKFELERQKQVSTVTGPGITTSTKLKIKAEDSEDDSDSDSDSDSNSDSDSETDRKKRRKKSKKGKADKKKEKKEDPNLTTIMSAFTKAFSGQGEVNVAFRFENLGLTLPSGVSILNGVTGCIPSRSLTAIMGPSGGK